MAEIDEVDLVQITSAVNKLVDKMDAFIDHQQQGSQVQTVVHRTSGVTPWVAAAVTACFLTYLTLIILAIWASFQINNLWAWKDVHAAKIAVLEGKANTHTTVVVEPSKEKPK